MWHRRMDGCGSPGGVPHPVSLPPTFVAGSLGTVVMCSGIGLGVSPPGGGSQDAPEGRS